MGLRSSKLGKLDQGIMIIENKEIITVIFPKINIKIYGNIKPVKLNRIKIYNFFL